VITVVTPTVPGREQLLAECVASVDRAGLTHLVGLDAAGEGPAVVRNRLLEHVTTPWVVWLDDDDLIDSHYTRIVERHLPAADVVYTAWDLTGADQPRPLPGGFDPGLLQRGNYIPVTACCRVDAVRAVGGFPADADLEDWALWKALAAAGYRFRYVPIVGWTYRRRSGSRTEAA
jgi:hypothetical protein